MKIDFVVTWVDSNDKEWLSERNKYAPQNDKIQESRYRDWDILKYWFRAIEKNASWVNKIYFITYGHVPKWLNTECEKIVIIKHEDYIEEKYLPTFNSCVLELNMHKIKGLSENFVYFNDDMFVNGKISKEDFFFNSLPCDTKIKSPIWYHGKNSTLINYNCARIIKKHFNNDSEKMLFKPKDYFKKILFFNKKPINAIIPEHVPTAYLKTTFEEIWEKEGVYLSEICTHKFRTKDDVSQWLFQFWQIESGKYIERREKIAKYYEINSQTIDDDIREIESGKYRLICINDSELTKDYEINKTKLIEMFERMYGEKSNFEK